MGRGHARRAGRGDLRRRGAARPRFACLRARGRGARHAHGGRDSRTAQQRMARRAAARNARAATARSWARARRSRSSCTRSQVVADSELPVLLLGETGVGKELFAHRLHRLSRRAGKPLVHVNCAALPESLAESELFGHARGAFSGAVQRPPRTLRGRRRRHALPRRGGRAAAVDPGQAAAHAAERRDPAPGRGPSAPRRRAHRGRHQPEPARSRAATGRFAPTSTTGCRCIPIPIPPLRERGNDVLLLAGRLLEQNRARLGLRSLRLSDRGGGRDARVSLARQRARARARDQPRRIEGREPRRESQGDRDARARHARPRRPARRRAASARRGPRPAARHAPAAARCARSWRRASARRYARHSRAIATTGRAAARDLKLDASNLHKLARRLGLKEGATEGVARRDDAGPRP